MQKKLLSAIIKSKIQNKKTTNELIDEFIKTQAEKPTKHLEDILSNLLVYINKNYEKIQSKSILKIINSKLKEINITFDTKDCETIYERLAIDNTITKADKPTIEFVFDKIDLKAIESMRDNFYWVGTEYSEKIQDKLKDTIEKAYTGEITRESLSAKLKDEFEDVLKASTFYFTGVADHILNQSQNIAKVNQALKYDVKHFKVLARIDKKTSDICRSMHCKIIEASHLSNQVTNIVNAKNMAEKKDAATWKNEAVFGKLPKNFGLPPFHFKCRTEVVPVWINTKEIDGKKVKYTSKKKDDIITHIDKTGVQRRADKNTFNHSDTSRARKIPNKDVISALNSITDIAPHKEYPSRTVAKSANGYFMVFDADYLYTMMKMPRKNYFKDNANLEKGDVIKWKNIPYELEMAGQSKIKKMLIKISNLIK